MIAFVSFLITGVGILYTLYRYFTHLYRTSDLVPHNHNGEEMLFPAPPEGYKWHLQYTDRITQGYSLFLYKEDEACTSENRNLPWNVWLLQKYTFFGMTGWMLNQVTPENVTRWDLIWTARRMLRSFHKTQSNPHAYRSGDISQL